MDGIQKNNILSELPKKSHQEIFETLTENSNIKIERIISTGQSTSENEWYDQKQSEWIMLLKGNATLRFKNEEQLIVLTEGDYVNIPAHTQHRVESTSSDTQTIWLAIHYR